MSHVLDLTGKLDLTYHAYLLRGIMPLRCPRCFSGDFYETVLGADYYVCKECGYTGHFFFDLEDDTAVPKLRKYNKIVPLPYDTTDFSRWGIIALILLIVLFLSLIYIVLGPHPG